MQLFPPRLRVLTLLNEVALLGEVEKLRWHPLPLERGPVTPDIGKPYLRATTSMQALALFEIKPGSDESEPGHSMEPDAGSISLRWWTRSQRIGTFAEVPIEAAILDTDAASVYQQIAPKAFQLQQLGMSNVAVAKRIGATDKPVAKAIDWLWRIGHRPDG